MTNDERQEIVKRLYILDDTLKRLEKNVQALIAYVKQTETTVTMTTEIATDNLPQQIDKAKFLKIF